jgi:hypothetical protein
MCAVCAAREAYKAIAASQREGAAAEEGGGGPEARDYTEYYRPEVLEAGIRAGKLIPGLLRQGFGSGSAWIRINLICWIRIRIQEGKMTHKNRKKSRIFMFLSTGCSFLRAEGFSCSLGVLYRGLGISKLQFLIKKIEIKFTAINFFHF